MSDNPQLTLHTRGHCFSHVMILSMVGVKGARWASNKIKSPHERFWAKVHKTKTCWLWTGAGCPRYGRFRPSRESTKMLSAHHFSWMEAGNEIPRGKLLLHSCDNMPCVRPAHLRLGNQTENMHDALLRARRITGNHKRNVKLTPDDVRAVRTLITWCVPAKLIAEMFGTTTRPIWYIGTGQRWAWLQ